MCPRKQTAEPKLQILVSFSSGKLPHTLIPVIASTYCGKCGVPFFWATLYCIQRNTEIIGTVEERERGRERERLWKGRPLLSVLDYVFCKVRYSEGSLIRRFVIPKVRYSEHTKFVYTCSFVNLKMK